MRGCRRGGALVEMPLGILILAFLFAGFTDLVHVTFALEGLQQRVRAGARYSVVHAFDTTAVRNYVLYNTASPPNGAATILGIPAHSVTVSHYDAGAPSERIEVTVTGVSIPMVSPWLNRVLRPAPFRAVVPVESLGQAH